MSLVTCTPFGVNTHRLVVTARRAIVNDNILGPSSIDTIESPKISLWEQEYIKGITLGLIWICVFCSAVILPIRHQPKFHHREFSANLDE